MAHTRIRWLDAAKGLSILLVILWHVTTTTRDVTGVALPVQMFVNETFSPIRMPLFFLVSGMVASKYLTASFSTIGRAKIWPLLWASTIWSIVSIVTVALFVLPGRDGTTVWKTALRIIVSPVFPNGALWFLFVLAASFVTLRALAALRPVLHVGLAGAVALVFSLVVGAFGYEYRDVILNNAYEGYLRYYLFFAVGALYGRRIIELAGRLKLSRAAIAAAAGVGIIATLASVGIAELPGVAFVVRLFGAAVGIVLAVALQSVTLLTHLGARTLWIYVAHGTVYTIGLWIATKLMPRGWDTISTNLLVGALLVACVLIGLLLAAASKRSRATDYAFTPPPLPERRTRSDV